MSNHKSQIRMAVENLTPVSEFLDSRCSDSVSTRRAYTSGLVSINTFLSPKDTLETILDRLKKGHEDLYKLLDNFTKDQKKKVSVRTVRLNLAVLRSYLSYHDIDIKQEKFKQRVKVPRLLKTKEAAVDTTDVRKILLACSNRRLKVYILVLASGAMRAVEALSLRIQDVDSRQPPTKVHIRAEFSKTGEDRDIYISDEATQYLKKWIDWKYRNGRTKTLDDLIFGVGYSDNPRSLYVDIDHEFGQLLDLAGFGERKVNSIRRKITLHSLRRFADTTISTEAGKDYAEWFLGHSDNSYFTQKEKLTAEIYATKCMKYLTFLDYTTLEVAGKNIDARLSEKDKQIDVLKSQMAEMESNMEARLLSKLTAFAEKFGKQSGVRTLDLNLQESH